VRATNKQGDLFEVTQK